jgi:hypothetical protein
MGKEHPAFQWRAGAKKTVFDERRGVRRLGVTTRRGKKK